MSRAGSPGLAARWACRPTGWRRSCMFVMAVVFQILMTRFQWGRAVFSIGGNETAALFSGIAIGRVKTTVYVLGGVLAAVAGVVLVIVQGQGKADLATGYELDIIASAVVGGASLAGGRGSVVGAVLGTLIFGVLRNALPQIPGRDVLRSAHRRRRRHRDRGDGSVDAREDSRYVIRGQDIHRFLCSSRLAVAAADWVRAAAPDPTRSPAPPKAALRGHPEGARHSGLQLREDRRRTRGGRTGRRPGAVERAGHRRSAEAERDPRVVHHAKRGRHRDLGAQRRLPHRDDQPCHGCRHPGGDVGLRCAELEAHRLLRRGRPRVGPHSRRADDQAAERQGQGRDHHELLAPPTCRPASTARRKRSPRRPASRLSRSTTSRKT